MAPAPACLWWGPLGWGWVGDVTQRTPKGQPGSKAGSTRLKTGILVLRLWQDFGNPRHELALTQHWMWKSAAQ